MRGMAQTQFLRKLNNATPTILTCLGAIGVVATAVMAVKETPKALRLLEDAEYEKGEELTVLEKANVVAPVYIPSVIVGVSTIACIFGANALNRRQQASLISAYALLENSYKNYERKVSELYGNDANKQVKEEIIQENYTEDSLPVTEGNSLFFDFRTGQYFEARLEDVLQKTAVGEDGLECYIISTPFDDVFPMPLMSY